jgi:hypothetical protein
LERPSGGPVLTLSCSTKTGEGIAVRVRACLENQPPMVHEKTESSVVGLEERRK